MEPTTSRRRAIALLALAPLLVLLHAGQTVADPAVVPTPSVSDTVSGATDTVSDTVSGATDTVSGATGAVSGAASGATGTASGAASGATGTDVSTGAGAASREGSTRMVVGASGGTRGSSADGDSRDVGRCDPQTSTCIGGTSDEGGLADAVERILGFLAQTGLPLAGWIAVAVGLALLGTFLVLRTRRGTSKGEPQELRQG